MYGRTGVRVGRLVCPCLHRVEFESGWIDLDLVVTIDSFKVAG